MNIQTNQTIHMTMSLLLFNRFSSWHSRFVQLVGRNEFGVPLPSKIKIKKEQKNREKAHRKIEIHKYEYNERWWKDMRKQEATEPTWNVGIKHIRIQQQQQQQEYQKKKLMAHRWW